MPERSTGSPLRRRELLAAAREGGEDEFARLVKPHRVELHAHCYRMLGSVHDAEDALQEALLRAWRGLGRLETDGTLRPWLYRIATNVCLDTIARRPKRVLPVDYGPPTDPAADAPDGRGTHAGDPVAESVWIEPYPDDRLGVEDGYAAPEARYEQRESLELAFIAALQHLPARQRAVLILREVLGFSAQEVAGALETTATSVNSALQRARKTVEERLPQQSQQATLRAIGDQQLNGLVERFIDAFENADLPAILALLSDDASFSMPPYPDWCRGREKVAESWLMPSSPEPRLFYIPTRANGQLALGTYSLSAETGTYVPIALDVLALEGALIGEVIAFRGTEVFEHFGLPAEVEPGSAR